jgi:hypothetical protein
MQMRQRSIIGHDFPSLPSVPVPLPLCLIRIARCREELLLPTEVVWPSAKNRLQRRGSIVGGLEKAEPFSPPQSRQWRRFLRPTLCIPVYTVSQSAIDWSIKLSHRHFPQDSAAFPLVLIGRHGLAAMYLWASRLPAGRRFRLLVGLAPRSLLPLALLAIGRHRRVLGWLCISFRNRMPVAADA